MGARAVTPRLAVGEFGTTSQAHVEAFDAWTASRLIEEGVVVLVPSDEVARDTLRLLDLDDRAIEERIQFSRTGQVRDNV